MLSRMLPTQCAMYAVTFLLLAGHAVSVLGQQGYARSKDWDSDIVIDRKIIVFDHKTLERFYGLFCKSWAGKFSQPIVKIGRNGDQMVYQADSRPESIRAENRQFRGDPVTSLLCRVSGGQGREDINCHRRDDAIHQCRSRRDCHEFHLTLNDDMSTSGTSCSDTCVNIAWGFVREQVTFHVSDRLKPRSKFPVISEGLCPGHPLLQSKTTTNSPVSTTDNSTASGESSRGNGKQASSSKVIIALSIAGILLLLLIVAVILFVVCYRRKKQNQYKKSSIAVQTNSRPIRRWNVQRPAFLPQNLYRNHRNPRSDPQPEPPVDDGSNSSPHYYEISNVIYEEPMHIGLEDFELETEGDKGDDYEYRKLHATRSEKLPDTDDTLLVTYGKDSASAEKPRPPDLVPAGELARSCLPVAVPITHAPAIPSSPPLPSTPASPPLPKPRGQSTQSTFKIRN